MNIENGRKAKIDNNNLTLRGLDLVGYTGRQVQMEVEGLGNKPSCVVKDLSRFKIDDSVKLNKNEKGKNKEVEEAGIGVFNDSDDNASIEQSSQEPKQIESIKYVTQTVIEKESEYTLFSRLVSPGAAIIGGIVGGYVAYQNPAVVLEALEGLDYNTIISTIMPYADELITAGGAIAGYVGGSLLGPVAFYSAVKGLQVINDLMCSLLGVIKYLAGKTKDFSIYLVIGLLKMASYLVIAILTDLRQDANLVYEHRGKVGMLMIACTLAYYNQEATLDLLQLIKAEFMKVGVIVLSEAAKLIQAFSVKLAEFAQIASIVLTNLLEVMSVTFTNLAQAGSFVITKLLELITKWIEFGCEYAALKLASIVNVAAGM